MSFYEPKPSVHPVMKRLENYKLNPVMNGRTIRFECPNADGCDENHIAIFTIGANDTDIGEFLCPTCHVSNEKNDEYFGVETR